MIVTLDACHFGGSGFSPNGDVNDEKSVTLRPAWFLVGIANVLGWDDGRLAPTTAFPAGFYGNV
jgi:hypothetical protein